MAGLINPFASPPGMGDPTLSTEYEFTWGPVEPGHLLGIVLVSSAVDTGTPTTILRRGLTLGMVTSTGKYKQYDPTATDGSQVPVGFLWQSRNMLDPNSGSAADQQGSILLKGSVKVGQLFGFDENARRILGNRFTYDDLRFVRGGFAPVVAKTTDYTVVNGTDNDLMFTNQGAGGAVNFTLPTTLQRGNRWRFYCEAGQTITVTAPANKLVAFNNATATSIALSTASEKIGGMIEVAVNADATKYLAIVYLGTETQTPVIA